MGDSYDAICFYGLVYSGGDESTDWPEATNAVLGDDSFEEWFDKLLGIPEWPEAWRTMSRQEMDDLRHREAELRTQRSLERFGVRGFETTYVGHIDYGCAQVVIPLGARADAWELGPVAVPQWSFEQLAIWGRACEMLAEHLPGSTSALSCGSAAPPATRRTSGSAPRRSPSGTMMRSRGACS